MTGKLVFGLAVALALAWTAPIREEAALPADAEAAADRLAAKSRRAGSGLTPDYKVVCARSCDNNKCG